MMNKFKVILIFLSISVCLFLFYSCASIMPIPIADGPLFSHDEVAEDDISVVYVYCPWMIVGKTNVFLWYGQSISPDNALRTREGLIMLYPISYRETTNGHLVTAARYYDLDHPNIDLSSEQDSEGRPIFNVIDASESGVRGGIIGGNVLTLSEVIGNTPYNTTIAWRLDSRKRLNRDIEDTREIEETQIMQVQHFPKPILSKSYFKLNLPPGKKSFWISTVKYKVFLQPYNYPKNVVTVDLEPGKKYFLWYSRGKNALQLEEQDTALSESSSMSILNCRLIKSE